MLFYINIYIHTNNSKFPMNLRAVLSKFQFILKKYFYYIFIVSDLIRRFTTLISLQTPGISAPVHCGTSRQVMSLSDS